MRLGETEGPEQEGVDGVAESTVFVAADCAELLESRLGEAE